MKKSILYFIIILSSAPMAFTQQANDQSLLANEYYIKGELEKARDIYKKLASQPNNIPQIHNNYFNTLTTLKDFKAAEKYTKKALKYFPSNIYYNIDLGILYQIMGDPEKSHKTHAEFLEKNKKNQFVMRTAAQYFMNKELTNYALEAYQFARKFSGNNTTYALELAGVYRTLGKTDLMMDEYLTFGSLRPHNLRYVKNILQNLLVEEEQIQSFQQILIDKIQKNPNQKMYGELLIWSNLQQKDFYGAFVQAKAIDRRFDKNGNRVLDIGRIALQNSAYDDAIEIFLYVVDKYAGTRNYITARRSVISAREGKVKNTYPVEKLALRALISDYQNLVDEVGLNPNTLEAYRSKALLHAFYLDEKDTAINILKAIINTPRAQADTKSKSKIDLGDIYLLKGEPWEATLLYSQVEKSNKDSRIGYDAKLKNAKLNYYKGEFELSKSHLDILKLATSREIANDAISLSLLIKDNTVLDTSDFVTKEFAGIDLLLFQNKDSAAVVALNSMLKKYPGHSLTDEIYWRLANINLQQANFETALAQLEQIQKNYADDILGDDAMYLFAKIHEENLLKPQQAMEIYNQFLLKYPGSVFTADARKRFRKLRGDEVY